MSIVLRLIGGSQMLRCWWRNRRRLREDLSRVGRRISVVSRGYEFNILRLDQVDLLSIYSLSLFPIQDDLFQSQTGIALN